MTVKQSKKIPIFAFFGILATLPVIGLHFDVISHGDAIYFYWAELALGIVTLLFLYAKHVSVFFAILLIAGLILSLNDNSVWEDLRVPMTFWGLYSLCWLLYFELGKTRIVQAILHSHFVTHLLFYLGYMAAALFGCFALTATLYDGWDLVPAIPQKLYILLISMAIIIPTLSIAVLKIIDIIGPNHVLHFFLGTYYRPVERKRIVLFLDMVGSTTIAEKLSPKDSMSLIAMFLYNSSLAFRIYGGDIINYTGDGLVVLWPQSKADNVIAAVEQLNKNLIKNHDIYMKKFGVKPDFRVGIHSGPVVISQIGEENLFIGLYGDTVNTAARLEQLCKEKGVKILLSKTVRQYLTAENKERTKALGMADLRGREERLEIYTLEDKPAQ